MTNKVYETSRGTAKSFTLAGERLDTGERFEITFECRPKVPGGLMLDFARATAGMSADDLATDAQKNDAAGAGIRMVMEVFEAAIQPYVWSEFQTVIRDPELAIELGVLIQIAQDLAGEYSGSRPTGGPSSDTSSARPSGPSSTPGARPTASLTYSRPEPPTPTAS